MEHKITHLLYVPFTGLGLYGGHRGNRWLRNRIKIFRQFVLPSLFAQTDQDFILWISWRYADRNDQNILRFQNELKQMLGNNRVVFTFAGVCFWDDKYPEKEAYDRLITSIHDSLPALFNSIGEARTILMTIQPSDDCYSKDAVRGIKSVFAKMPTLQAFGFKRGYVMDYVNRRLAEWNPKTTPPFFTIKFPREIFTDPRRHLEYTGPYKSHEYIGDKLKFGSIDNRGFLVGTHGENISTIFKHPYAGEQFEGEERERILEQFGLRDVPNLRLSISLRKMLMRRLPHGWQRKLRYWVGERFYSRFYNFIRA